MLCCDAARVQEDFAKALMEKDLDTIKELFSPDLDVNLPSPVRVCVCASFGRACTNKKHSSSHSSK